MAETPDAQRAADLISALACESRRESALRSLAQMSGGSRQAVIEGLTDGRWEVRRWCLWLLSQLHPTDLERGVPLLRDPKSRVRQMAVVVLGGAASRWRDRVSGLMERALEDDSIRVRRQAVLMLAYEHSHPQLEGFFQQLLEDETDARLHRYAGIGVWLCRQKRDAAGRRPPC